MSWGSDYSTAVSAYNALPLAEQARLAGYNFGGMDESGQEMWSALEGGGARGIGVAPNTDAGETAGSYVRANTMFNGQKYFFDQGIVPIDGALTGDGQNGYTRDMSPAQARAYADNQARSFNQYGYNFGGVEDLLRYRTGSGHIENDPELGEIWVPDNRDTSTWNESYMGASAAPGGNFIDKAVGNFANSGGFVKALGGAIIGAGAGDIFNGGADSWGNLMSPDAPYDVGQNLVNNPDVFGPGTGGAAIPPGGLQQVMDQLKQFGLSPSTALSAAQKLLTSTGGGSALANLFNSNGTLNTSNLLQAGGGALASILASVNASNTRSEYNGIADKYFNVGKPYRDELTRTFTDPNYLATSPGYTGALDQTMQAYLRKASTGGNPFTNPGVSQEILTGVNNSTALPYLSSTRNTLTNAGGLGLAQAGQANMAGAIAGSNILGSLGAGISSLTTPQPKTLADYLTQWNAQGTTGGNMTIPNPNAGVNDSNYDAGQNLTNNPAVFGNYSNTDYGSSEGYDLSDFGLV